jgi:hypothetical protein
MAPTIKRSFTAHPHETSLVEDKSMHVRIDSDLDIQWCYAPISKNLRDDLDGDMHNRIDLDVDI